MNDSYNFSSESLLEFILQTKSMLFVITNDGYVSDEEYQELRTIIIKNLKDKRLLPIWIISNIDYRSLHAHFDTLDKSPTELRRYIAEEFEPIIKFLLNDDGIGYREITGTLTEYNEHNISSSWEKAILRRKSDPEGAITSARTLIEEICKHILDDLKIEYDDKWDLPKLYSCCAKSLNLAPSQHTEQQFKQILGGCQTVVEGIGSLRNKLSDAHGGGKKRVKPAPRHAALTVNLAGSMAMFLVETLRARKDEGVGEDHAA